MGILNINSNSVVYILCPANIKTGGPEAIHQLSHELLSLNINCNIVYVDEALKLTTVGKHYEYKCYLSQSTDVIEDSSENVLIIPEIYVSEWMSEFRDKYLYPLKKIQKVVWWLASICPNSELVDNVVVKTSIHLAQSMYAKKMLEKNGLRCSGILSDYINRDILSFRSNGINRMDIVLYNPSKGYDKTKLILKMLQQKASNIKQIALWKLSRKDLIILLYSAKVYIDFGMHPGKDRLPREAVYAGCNIITGTEGAASYFKDIPIPQQYKIKFSEDSIEEIVDLIIYSVQNYELVNRDFINYKTVVQNDRTIFLDEIKKIFF